MNIKAKLLLLCLWGTFFFMMVFKIYGAMNQVISTVNDTNICIHEGKCNEKGEL